MGYGFLRTHRHTDLINYRLLCYYKNRKCTQGLHRALLNQCSLHFVIVRICRCLCHTSLSLGKWMNFSRDPWEQICATAPCSVQSRWWNFSLCCILDSLSRINWPAGEWETTFSASRRCPWTRHVSRRLLPAGRPYTPVVCVVSKRTFVNMVKRQIFPFDYKASFFSSPFATCQQ